MPLRNEHVCVWSDDWQCLYNSAADNPTLEDFLLDMEAKPYYVTRDRDGTRWSGKVQREVFGLRWIQEYDYLKHMLTWINPLFDADMNAKIDDILTPLYDDVFHNYIRWRNTR